MLIIIRNKLSFYHILYFTSFSVQTLDPNEPERVLNNTRKSINRKIDVGSQIHNHFKARKFQPGSKTTDQQSRRVHDIVHAKIVNTSSSPHKKATTKKKSRNRITSFYGSIRKEFEKSNFEIPKDKIIAMAEKVQGEKMKSG